MINVSKYILRNLLKSWFIIGYFLLLSAAGWGLFMIETHPEKALLTLMEVTLLAVPLICMIFATIYYYNSLEFILLLLAQPVKRSTIVGGFFISLSSILVGCYILGMGLPLLILHMSEQSWILLLTGTLLTLLFTSLALFTCTVTQDKTRGIGLTLLLWSFFAFIFDGLLLFLMYQFSDYPIEKGVLILSFFNPIDIGRILVIMHTEAAALLGYTGAIFRNFFGSTSGAVLAIMAMLVWTFLPLWIARLIFLKKDL